jgi:putative hemolysin
MTTDASQQKEPMAIREPKPVQPAFSAMEKFFFLKPLRRVYARVQGEEPGILERLLREMNITVDVAPEDLDRVPRTGAALVVANHPFGILDGAALGAILLRVRPDTKILTNSLVAAVDELEQHCIQIDPFARPGARGTNILGLRKAIAHLRGGGVLAVFPSGEVSHWQFRQSEVTDPEWNTTAARLARLSGAPVVPALFVGRNSLPFHLFGIIHPRLRTIQLSREFLKKAGQAIELRIGTPVPPQKIARLADDRQATDYLRWRTYLLRRRRPDPTQSAETQETYSRNLRPSRKALISEIESLDAQCKLHENQEFQVFVADAERIPRALVEIGRQRELAFQEVGAGTGRGVDLDPFDPHYKHLILWHKKDSQIAGGYRFVNTAEVLRIAGLQGLYTTTLFSIDPKFFESMGPMLEVGRSFVRRDYQKQYAPLMLMWRGIGRYVAEHPETPLLFGPVSISSAYTPVSRDMIFQFFKARQQNPLAQWIKPKRPFRRRSVSDWELQAIRCLLDIEDVSSSVAEIERDGKGVPVLLRQYLKIGGELLAFNVDKDFSDVLDGLILVDLRKTDPFRLETYMGKSGLASFLNHHAGVSNGALSS